MKLKKLLVLGPMILKRRTRLTDHPHAVLTLNEPSSLCSVLLLFYLANTNPPPEWTFLDRDQLGAEVAAGHTTIGFEGSLIVPNHNSGARMQGHNLVKT